MYIIMFLNLHTMKDPFPFSILYLLIPSKNHGGGVKVPLPSPHEYAPAQTCQNFSF